MEKKYKKVEMEPKPVKLTGKMKFKEDGSPINQKLSSLNHSNSQLDEMINKIGLELFVEPDKRDEEAIYTYSLFLEINKYDVETELMIFLTNFFADIPIEYVTTERAKNEYHFIRERFCGRDIVLVVGRMLEYWAMIMGQGIKPEYYWNRIRRESELYG